MKKTQQEPIPDCETHRRKYQATPREVVYLNLHAQEIKEACDAFFRRRGMNPGGYYSK